MRLKNKLHIDEIFRLAVFLCGGILYIASCRFAVQPDSYFVKYDFFFFFSAE